MYPGGKNGNGTFQTIINQIPSHEIYVEGFAGSAAIANNMRPCLITILCDKDREALSNIKKTSMRYPILLNCDTVASIEIFVTFLNVLHACGHHVFLYLDPPYPINSRSCQRKIYNFEMTDDEHTKLLFGVVPAKFPVAISTYKNQIYADILSTWRLLKFQSVTRKGLATEYLYMNYPEPSQLQDYSYIGSDYREREKYTRIKNNTVRKLSKMQPYLLQSILRELSKKI